MSAVQALPELAAEHGWAVDTVEPDMWGDVRSTAVGDTGTIRLTFDPAGTLRGGYLYDVRGRTFHTVRVTDVKRWITGDGSNP
ncbi:MAG TPA: hypothetical protein VJ777_19265 [Mycobacterium sp.]|nr:hypothetical protein [Mycobacterium sp.]